jgi:hypothetical protein
VRVEVERLEHHADAAAHGVDVDPGRHEVHALDPDRARRRLFQAVAAAQQRGFARARGADDEDQLASGDLEVDALENLEVAERLMESGNLENYLHFG